MKPLSPLTRLLVILLKINIGILILALVGDIYSWYEYSNLTTDVDIDEVLLTSEILSLLMGIIQVILAIFLGITFLRWIYRANSNLHILSSIPLTFSPGWSIGWYFIPVANFFKPYQAMKEIWIVAHRGASNSSHILGWWWFFWLISSFLNRISMKLSLRAEDVQSYKISAIADAFSDGGDLFLNVFALALVTMIARSYDMNYVEPTSLLKRTPTTSLDNSEITNNSSSTNP